jgi:hypothetical protein
VESSAFTSLVSELPANALLTLLIVPILQWVKRSDLKAFRWVNEQTAFIISGVLAAGGAMGIHFQYDPAMGDLHVTGLSVAGIANSAGEWAKQFASQHWGHRAYRALEHAGGKTVEATAPKE